MTTQVQETYLLRIDVNANTTTNYLTYYSCQIRNESATNPAKNSSEPADTANHSKQSKPHSKNYYKPFT